MSGVEGDEGKEGVKDPRPRSWEERATSWSTRQEGARTWGSRSSTRIHPGTGRSPAAPSGVLTGGGGEKILGTDRRRPGNTTSWSLLKTGGLDRGRGFWWTAGRGARPVGHLGWDGRRGRGRPFCDQLATDGSGEGTAGGPTVAGSDQFVVREGEDGDRGKDRRPWTDGGRRGRF